MLCYTLEIVSEKQIIFTLSGLVLPPYRLMLADKTGFRVKHLYSWDLGFKCV